MTRCPHCFTALVGDVRLFHCAGACAPEPDEVAAAYFGAARTLPRVIRRERDFADKRWQAPSQTTCELCEVVTEQEICPTCHWELPVGWRGVDTTCIATAGARSSGKTVYLALLKKHLDQRGESIGFLPAGIGDTDQRYREHYEAALWDERGRLLGGTTAFWQDQSRQPLMYYISPSGKGKRSHVLVVRDIAGENLEVSTPVEDSYAAYGYLGRADALFFLVDPLQISGVQEVLRNRRADQQVGSDPLVVLENLLRLARVDPTARFQGRLALVISKFDAVQDLRGVVDGNWWQLLENPGAAMVRDPSVDHPDFTVDDADLLHEELRSILVHLRAERLLLKVRTEVAHARLFAVSALGHAPKGEHIDERGIASFRVLDPLKWALSNDRGRPV